VIFLTTLDLPQAVTRTAVLACCLSLQCVCQASDSTCTWVLAPGTVYFAAFSTNYTSQVSWTWIVSL